jgi:hypothetical protein
VNLYDIFGYATHHVPALCFGAGAGFIVALIVIIPACWSAFNVGFRVGYDNGWMRHMTGWSKGKGWKRTLEERRKRK